MGRLDELRALAQAPTVDWIEQLGSGLINPEDDCCCDADSREEGMGASVIAGCDAPPVLEFSEQVLDLVALPVDRLVIGEGLLAASA